MDYNVLDYGAKGDGITLDTISFQKAIDECEASGGGRVVVNKDHTYILGSIELKSNVELYLEENSVMKLSSNLDDFINLGVNKDVNIYVPTWENCEYDGKPTKFFIYAKEKSNIKISGFGSIDGNEEIFYGTVSKWHIEGAFYPRIPLLCLIGINNLTITNVTLTRSAFWTCHLVGCNNVLIDSIKILNNLRMVNSDGIDPDHCKNVTIKNCKIECADDCIVLKSTEGYREYGPSENIHVFDCDLVSTSAAIKFGSESVSDFNNISFKNINIHDSNRGISFQLRDEGNISNVSFENIKIGTRFFSPLEWWGKAEAIAISSVSRTEKVKSGIISNVSFKNISHVGENGIFIYGSSKNIKDITFENVDLKLISKTRWDKTVHDIRPCYGEGVFNENLSFIYVNEASNIEFNNIKTEIDDTLKDVEVSKDKIYNSSNITINYL